MPGFVIHVGATANCPHAGSISVAPSNTRVRVSGQLVATLADGYPIAGCPLQIPGPKPQPCVRVQWSAPAARVKVMGQPVILQTSSGICLSAEQIPQGLPLVTAVQTRVVGT
jgi:hypothetical protein